MKETLHCEGFNIVQNNGSLAGQTVFHYHMHLIPRYSGDGQNIAWKPTTVEQSDLEAICNQIKY